MEAMVDLWAPCWARRRMMGRHSDHSCGKVGKQGTTDTSMDGSLSEELLALQMGSSAWLEPMEEEQPLW